MIIGVGKEISIKSSSNLLTEVFFKELISPTFEKSADSSLNKGILQVC